MLYMKGMIGGDFEMSEIGKGRYLYGVVTVAERGQIVIPKEAREHFNIKPGDKLLVTGDLKRGLGIVKAEKMKEFAQKIMGAIGGPEKTE
jgi:AbrB family looped-hinge helix DNA binding protein